jgi:hypothetical protein
VTDDEFIEQRGADGVDFEETGKIRHVILIRCLVRDDIDALQRGEKDVPVGNVSLNECGPGRHVAGPAMGMNSGIEAVQDDDLKTVAQKTVDQMGSDEARTTCH